jgi:NADPH-ferrihemoprotein reductase
MDWLGIDTTWLLAIGVVVLGTVYWFFFRDDNGFPEPEQINLKIKPVIPGLNKPKTTVLKRTDGKPLKILFYTQTGTAEDFARRLGDDMMNYGFCPDVLEVEGFEGETLSEEKMVVFFAATYGEGDPPDNAIEFHEWLMDKERDTSMFSGLKYAVFGLGNKTYPEYNVIGKQIDKRMEELGATRIYPLGLGNDDENIEDDFLVWKKGFAPVVCKEFGLEPPGDLSHAKMIFKQKWVIHEPSDVKLRSFTKDELDSIPKWRKPKKPQTMADRNTPYLATIVTKKELHKVGSGRSCLHLEVSTHKEILQYQTGDHIGIYPENEDHLVAQLAKLLKMDPEQVVSIFDISNDSKPIVGPCTIRALLTQYFDIAFYAKKTQLRVLAQYATDKTEQDRLFKLSSDEPGNIDYENYIVKANRTIMEVLSDFPSVQVPHAHFFEHCPKLQPRYYSISSSPHQHNDTVHYRSCY